VPRNVLVHQSQMPRILMFYHKPLQPVVSHVSLAVRYASVPREGVRLHTDLIVCHVDANYRDTGCE
jgi:hypothetical protein